MIFHFPLKQNEQKEQKLKPNWGEMLKDTKLLFALYYPEIRVFWENIKLGDLHRITVYVCLRGMKV